MLRRLSSCGLVLVFALAGVACERAGANASPKTGARTRAPGDIEVPEWINLPWGTALSLRPDGPRLYLSSGPEAGGPGRAVRVVGSEGEWWIVETVAAHELPDPAATVIEHLDVYRLRFYVPAGSGEAIATPTLDEPEAARAAALMIAGNSGILGLLGGDPPLQSGELRDAETLLDWRVEAGSVARWPDGSEAGSVTETHAFANPGRELDGEHGLLRCFEIVFGPGPSPAGELCFEAEAVIEGQPMQSMISVFGEDYDDLDGLAGLYSDDVDAFAELYGDEFGGLIGEDYDDLDQAIGDIGGIGHGGGGSGYGSGIGTIGRGGGGGGGYGGGIVGDIEGGIEGGVEGGVIGGVIESSPAEPEPEPELPELELRTFAFSGSSPDAAERVVRARTRSIAACVAERGPATGKLRVSFEVDEGGKVSAPKVDAGDADLVRCAKDKLARWRFPSAAPGTVTLELSW